MLAGSVVEPGAGWPTHFPAPVGPLLAAVLVASRTGGLPGLLSRVGRVRVGPRWWAVAFAPLGLLAVGLLVTALAGAPLPRFADFGVISGLPAVWGPALVGVVVVLVNGFGEETGWHGLFNLACGTATASGTVAAVVSAGVVVRALLARSRDFRRIGKGWYLPVLLLYPAVAAGADRSAVPLPRAVGP